MTIKGPTSSTHATQAVEMVTHFNLAPRLLQIKLRVTTNREQVVVSCG